MKAIITLSILCSAAAFGCHKRDAQETDTTRTTSAIVVEPKLDDTQAAGSTEDTVKPDNAAKNAANGFNGNVDPNGNYTAAARDGGVMLDRDRNGESFEQSGGSSGLGTPPMRTVPGQNRFDTK